MNTPEGVDLPDYSKSFEGLVFYRGAQKRLGQMCKATHAMPMGIKCQLDGFFCEGSVEWFNDGCSHISGPCGQALLLWSSHGPQ
jgi:hypothetical protein